MPNTKRRWIAWLVLAVFVLLCNCLMEFPIKGPHIVLGLLIGWVAFLVRVVPPAITRWDMILASIVGTAILLAASHLLLPRIYRRLFGHPAAAEPVALPAAWNWHWTFRAFLLFAVLFASGAASVTLVRQTPPLFTRRVYRFSESRNRRHCVNNLQQIGQALAAYVRAHDGKYPDDLSELLLKSDLNPEVFICQSTDDEPATGHTREELAASLRAPGHCSYIYVGKGLSSPVEPDRLIACDHLSNHDRYGVSVLYGDGHVEWFYNHPSEDLAARLGLDKNGYPATRD